MNFSNLTRYLIKPAFAGIFLAALIIAVTPSLRENLTFFGNDINRVQSVSLSSAVRAAAPSVVNIYSQRQQKGKVGSRLTPQGLGSGIIMRSDGIVLTNYHVVSAADQIYVALQDGRWANAEMIGSDPWTDLAVLKIGLTDLPTIPLDLNREAQVGDIVLAIGNPYNLGQTITQGIISATGRAGLSSSYQDFIQTDAAINQGNSGGALVDADGMLVGVNTANYRWLRDSGVGLNFAIPIKLAYTIMEKLIRDGRVIRGHLGVTGTEVNQTIARLLRLEQLFGVYVSEVDPNGPSIKAGIKPEDVLIAINDKTITDPRMLMDTIAAITPGTEVKLTLIRQGEELTLPVTVWEKTLRVAPQAR